MHFPILPRISKFILGRASAEISATQYKRIILTGQLCIVSCVLCVVFTTLEFVFGPQHSWPFLVINFLICLVSFFLNWHGDFSVARILLACTINLTIFIICVFEPVEIGAYTFFMVTALGSLAIFGQEEKAKAIIFAGIPMALFLLSILVDFNLTYRPVYPPDLLLINVIFNFSGSIIGSFLIVNFLITVNHHSETSLRANESLIKRKNQELMKLNTELDSFVYSTSHDLRAPLNSIQGLIQLTKMTGDETEIRRYIEIMGGRVAKLTKFIGDISDYSRNARLDVSYTPTNVTGMVTEILETLKFYPGSERITVNLDLPDGLEIMTDPMRLQVILGNLISNSFKYYDPAKEKSFITISSLVRDRDVEIRVEDNGIGIHPKYMSNIFDMFFQATDKSEGSGLGLYIVKEAVDKLNGSLHVESEPQGGTCFQVQLPTSLREGM